MTEPDTQSKDPDSGWQLGCAIGIAIIGFFIWALFIRAPDPEWRAKVDAEVARQQEADRIRIENARWACDQGVASACVEYAQLIE